MKKEGDLFTPEEGAGRGIIRRGTVEDVAGIDAITDGLVIDLKRIGEPEYVEGVEQKGFLVYKDPDLKGTLHDGKRACFVYEKDGVIEGYCIGSLPDKATTLANARWINQDLCDAYASPHATLDRIAVVSSQVQRKGIATMLLEEVVLEARRQKIPYLFSFAVFSPISNSASMRFHESRGFELAATVSTPKAFGLENYKTRLYGMDLRK